MSYDASWFPVSVAWVLAAAGSLIWAGETVDTREFPKGLSGRITYIRMWSRQQPAAVERIDLTNRQIETLVEANADRPIIRSFSYSPDRSRSVYEMGGFHDRRANNEIYMRSTVGGKTVQVTDNRVCDHYPSWSLDGKRIAFTRGIDGIDEQVHLILDLESMRESEVPTPGFARTRAPLRFLDSQRLIIKAFDETGSKGLAVCNPGEGTARWLVKAEAHPMGLSQDRKRLAVILQERRPMEIVRKRETNDFSYHVHVLDLDTGGLEPVKPKPSLYEEDVCAAWSPDGKTLAWVRYHVRERSSRLLIAEPGETRPREVLFPDQRQQAKAVRVVWSPDGLWLACAANDTKGASDEPTRCTLDVINVRTGELSRVLTSQSWIGCCDWEQP